MTDTQSPFGAYAPGSMASALIRKAQSMPVSWLGRRSALFIRKAVLKTSPAPVMDVTVEGLKLRLYMNDNVSERKFLFMPQFFDKQERDLIRAKLPADGVFVDIGANAGIYTMTAAARLTAGGRVLAVEPNPAVLTRLKFNAALNGFEDRIRIEQACVAGEAGTIDLVLDDTNLGGSSIALRRSSHKITVDAWPLAEILKRHGISHVDMLKIDVEGAEDIALIPFLTAAPRDMLPAHIILENSPAEWKQDLKGALEKAGYALKATTRMNMIWQRAG
ncbi:MAG: FkbM family methyltransferase [Alphaproteobacteria bacterium]|nr:FkbM family methyltransferase [Alphaproteobacteria bacterium]